MDQEYVCSSYFLATDPKTSYQAHGHFRKHHLFIPINML